MENLAKDRGLENIPKEVFEYIATYIKDNVRELEGKFNKLSAFSEIQGEAITLNFAKSVLKCEENQNKPTIQKVAEVVADYFDVTVEDFLSSARVQNISNARAIVSYISREKLQLSYESIGDVLNKRHQTVMYSAEKIKKTIKTDKKLEKDINKILKNLDL